MNPETTSLRDLYDEQPIAFFIMIGLILTGGIASAFVSLLAILGLHCHQFGCAQLPDGIIDKTAFLFRTHWLAFIVFFLLAAVGCVLYFRHRLKERFAKNFMVG